MILVQIKASVSPSGHEEVAVLREVPRQPDGRLVRLLAQVREPFRWMLGSHIVQPELGLERSYRKLQNWNEITGEGQTRGGKFKFDSFCVVFVSS